MTRTPFTTQVNFQVKMGSARRLTLLADVFNLFDQQAVLNYVMWTNLTFGDLANPNFGQRNVGDYRRPTDSSAAADSPRSAFPILMSRT